MDSILVQGGKPLVGDIWISGAKNAALPIMAACLLTSEACYLENIPRLSDIDTMKLLLINHGVNVAIESHLGSAIMKIEASDLNNLEAPYDIVRKMRASIWSLGPLLARYGNAKVSLPGGCAIGARQVDLHISSLKSLGAEIIIKDGYIYARSEGRLKGAEFSFAKCSVGATINAVMAASLAEGESVFYNCAIEPEVADVCNFLNTIGAKIHGIGSTTLRIDGQKALHGGSYRVMPDRIEAGTYMIAAAMTRGNLNIHGIKKEVLGNLIAPLQSAGIDISYVTVKDTKPILLNYDLPDDSEKENYYIKVQSGSFIKPVDIETGPYPAFSTDLQAQFLSLMTLSTGKATINENVFENRFMHVPELCRMGANILISSHSAIIDGVEYLSAAQVMASDLRASVSLVIAALAAKGQTKILRVYHLDRGYEGLEQKLQACGAEIQRVR